MSNLRFYKTANARRREGDVIDAEPCCSELDVLDPYPGWFVWWASQLQPRSPNKAPTNILPGSRPGKPLSIPARVSLDRTEPPSKVGAAHCSSIAAIPLAECSHAKQTAQPSHTEPSGRHRTAPPVPARTRQSTQLRPVALCGLLPAVGGASREPRGRAHGQQPFLD